MSFSKTISDDVEATEFLVEIDYPGKPLFDDVDSPESNNILSINTTIDDTADLIDSGSVDFNPYTIETYFAETYTSGVTTF